MNKFLRYLKVQCIRAGKYYPFILVFTIILSVSILMFAGSMFRKNDNAEDKKRFEIALVGDTSGSYLDVGISTITEFDSSKYYVEFSEMEEDEAKEKLLAGKIYGYVLIPDGFLESIIYGENKPLTYVSANNPASLGPVLTNEIVQVVGKLVIQSQNGIYGLIDIANEYHVSSAQLDEAIVDANIKYISAVLGRDGFYEITYAGEEIGLSYQEYYTCAFIIILIMLWGMACATMLIRQNMSLLRILKSKGYSVGTMVLGDYIPFLLMICCNAGLLLLVGTGSVDLFVNMLPMILMLCAMQFLLYELASNVISGVLMQLFVTILLSYASGFFYPIYSLPEFMQKVSAFLPTGIAFQYFSEILQGKTGWQFLPKVWIYGIMCILLSMIVRQYKIRSNKYD